MDKLIVAILSKKKPSALANANQWAFIKLNYFCPLEKTTGVLHVFIIFLNIGIKFFCSCLVRSNPISIHLYTATFVTLLLNKACTK